MDIQKLSLIILFAVLFSGLSTVGAIEIYNKTVTGVVLRPWIARIEADEGIETYSKAELIDSGRRAQGIPEGMTRKPR